MERKWWTLIAVSVATFMLLLDITVVNVALPTIRDDLGASFSDLQWVVDAYALTLAALVLTAGSLADRLGRRRVFATGLVIFSGASLLCALAPDPTFLNLARAVQGVGGAVMFAVSLALIAQEFEAGRERGMAMGAYGATIGVAVAVGPLVGGALTDSLGWESIFYLNVPIGIGALAITQLKLRESRDPHATRVDWVGTATFSTALFLAVLALVRGNDEGWGSTLIVALFAGAAALMVAFLAVERRVSEPMLPLGLFRSRAFAGVQLAAFAISSSIFALFLYITLYLQNYLGLTPLEAGLRYLPITVVSFFAAPVAGLLLSRVQARLMLFVGLTGVGARAAADGRDRGRLGVDDPARRLRDRRRGGGPAQPGDRRRRRQRRPEGAERHGGRHQRHLPAGRGRGRHRRVGRDLRGQGRRQGRRADRGHAGRERRPPAPARRGRLVGQPRSGARGGSAAGARRGRPRGPRGLPDRVSTTCCCWAAWSGSPEP